MYHDLNHDYDKIVEEYVLSIRSGRVPPSEDYIRKYPEYATDLHEIFRGLRLAEALNSDSPNLDQWMMPTRIRNYLILRELARGGMGIVYEAQQEGLDRRVVVKVLSKSFVDKQGFRQRFEREAKSTSKLHHPHIVPVFDYGVENNHPWLAMPLINGPSLDRVLYQSEGRQPAVSHDWKSLARLGSQLTSAIEYAHSCDIIHRDIKPGNILLDDHGKIWITDFGLSQIIKRNREKDREVSGTARYMAPEQFLGYSDVRSDIYSIGITLWEMACGKRATEARKTRSLLSRSQSNIEPISKFAPEIPDQLAQIIMKTCAFQPDDRFQTAAELKDALDEFVSPVPIPQPPSPIPKVKPRRTMSTLRMLAYIMVAVLCGAVMTLLSVQPRSESAQAAVPYQVLEQQVDAWPQLDGSLIVEERTTYDVRTQLDSIRREFETVGNQQVTGLTISGDSGRRFSQIKGHDKTEQPDSFTVHSGNNTTSIVLRGPLNRGKSTLVTRYIVTNAVQRYREHAEIDFRTTRSLSAGSCGAFVARVHPTQELQRDTDVQAWLLGPMHANAQIAGDGTLSIAAPYLPPLKPLMARIVYPSEAFPLSKYSRSDKPLEQIEREVLSQNDIATPRDCHFERVSHARFNRDDGIVPALRVQPNGGISLNQNATRNVCFAPANGLPVVYGPIKQFTIDVDFSTKATDFEAMTLLSLGSNDAVEIELDRHGILNLEMDDVRCYRSAPNEFDILLDGQRHVLTVTWNSVPGWRIYVDGRPAAKGPGPKQLLGFHGPENQLVLGQNQRELWNGFDLDKPFIGTYYRVRIGNRSFSPSEVYLNYARETLPPRLAYTLISQWNFDHTNFNGDVLRDSVGNNDLAIRQAASRGLRLFHADTPSYSIQGRIVNDAHVVALGEDRKAMATCLADSIQTYFSPSNNKFYLVHSDSFSSRQTAKRIASDTRLNGISGKLSTISNPREFEELVLMARQASERDSFWIDAKDQMGNPVTLDCCIRSLVADLPEELPNPIIEWEANDVLAQPVRCSIARQSVEGAFKITEDGTIQIADSKRVSTRRLHQVTVMMQDIDGRFHRLRLAIHHQQ